MYEKNGYTTKPVANQKEETWQFLEYEERKGKNHGCGFVTKIQEQERNYNNVINRTLVRYHKDNIPIEIIDLTINIKNQELAFLAEKWVHFVASKSSLKELYLRIRDNLNHVNCVSLRVLQLHHVRISKELLHKLLSTCTLLEKISLFCYERIKTIKINNLHCLREVKFESGVQNDAFEIIDVPSLKLFSYDSSLERRKKPPPFNICSLGSITELYLDGVVIDASLFHIIETKLPFLESLTLDMRYSQAGNLDITSVSLKRMTLKSLLKARPVYIQVNAPKLLYFCYDGWNNIASLLFTTITLENITIILTFAKMVDHSFFLNMSEVLNFSSKFHFKLDFSGYGDVVHDIDNLRRNLLFPAKNIQQLSLDMLFNGPWLKHIFFDVFFSVCHPNYVSLRVDKKNYPLKLLAREVLKFWHDYPKDVEIKNPLNGEWEPLTTAWISIHDKLLLAELSPVLLKVIYRWIHYKPCDKCPNPTAAWQLLMSYVFRFCSSHCSGTLLGLFPIHCASIQIRKHFLSET
ncbi:F-box protein-like protein [Tanacetum coccineum]